MTGMTAARYELHHCEERNDAAIQKPQAGSGLLRSARNDGELRSRLKQESRRIAPAAFYSIRTENPYATASCRST